MFDPYSVEACIWALATCVFWGIMRFSKVAVSSQSAFDKTKHLKQQDVFFGVDLDGKHYAWLDLPSARTVKPREVQSVFMIPQGGHFPIKALQNLACIVPARPEDPLFSW